MWDHDNFPVELLQRLPQQLEVGNAIAVAGQNYLPRVPTLRNMMTTNAGTDGSGTISSPDVGIR